MSLMPPEIESLRFEMNKVDSQLFPLLTRRFELSDQIIAAKVARGLPVEDRDREKYILAIFRSDGPKTAKAIEAILKIAKEGWGNE